MNKAKNLLKLVEEDDPKHWKGDYTKKGSWWKTGICPKCGEKSISGGECKECGWKVGIVK